MPGVACGDWVTGLFYEWLSFAIVASVIAYCVIAIAAVISYKRRLRKAAAPHAVSDSPPISVLRPLAGADDSTEANLRSLFRQNYGNFEVLLGVHQASDPAAEIACGVMAEFPNIPARLVMTGKPLLPNAKVWSLSALAREARNEILVMADSDVHLPAHAYATLVEELERPGVALVSCPYRAVGTSLWSRVQALGLNTEFISEILTAVFLMDCDFAIGCAVATRRRDLDAIGGLESMGSYLAEDFVMGQRMARSGRRVLLSRTVVDHHIGGADFASCWRHRMRWTRSTRRSRRSGYAGEIFTKTLAVAAIVFALRPETAPLAAGAVAVRLALAWAAATVFPGGARGGFYWLLLPLEDLLSFTAWVGGFFGDTVGWRGRALRLDADGRMGVVAQPEPELRAVPMESAEMADQL
jgi:ceramide glucosyltransferase